ncbi:hypothetical protein Ddye_004609 [Dipteronia dyeriana]|uniref:Uncharacterized protein n=1 Tax=Dipteronia dyeriana TaxID=168575 RepID=A0AAD9XVE3_9ROSI|nr:hypothetical protein Ddye_004609 [Dipteronia dyeriana]
MDKSKDHVCIDFDKLAESLTGKFQTLYPLSKDCCIYQVPPKIRMLNETLYTPKMVSIGPLHHGRAQLKPMQEHKLRYFQQFLQRTCVSTKDFLKFIKCKETDLRNCYAEMIRFGSEEFVEMILLDAVFLIEMFLRSIPKFQSLDRIFTKPAKIRDIVFDMVLLENQLPIFILQDLFNLAKPALPEGYRGYSLSQFTRVFFNNFKICQALSINETLIDSYFSRAEHFVDMLRLCLRPPKHDVADRQPDSEAVPNVTKLHQAGVKFKVVESKNLLDITFNKGTLEIPKLTIGNMTIHLLRNLQIYEGLHCDGPSDTNYMNDYNVILNRLLNTSKDVESLIHKGVIDNLILDSEGVSTLFGELSKYATVNHSNFYYSGLVKDLRDYCKYPCHKWKANLKQNYFNTPWASISVIAAVIILVLTFIQTVCSVIGL